MNQKENKKSNHGISTPYDNNHCITKNIRKEGPVKIYQESYSYEKE